MAEKKKADSAAKPATKGVKPVDVKKNIEMPFGKQNYILLITGVVLIFIGFLLMIGGGSKDPNVFSPALFDFQRLTLSPMLILAGFIVEIVAIMRKPKVKA
jgi:hypothetical protein